ncbi:glycosyltransferase [Bradyrhizobium vignae]|uniref:Glycosyltransferase n=1 Tax=Bradyrhizobium vignae TaxID=1549949 RepID=A0ABS4A0T9_9BRAD|nr:glycosyltransferase [Bradyrhizobium vignae]
MTHVSVQTLSDVTGVEPKEGMTIFWYVDRPIGHIMVHDSRTTNSKIAHVDADFLSGIAAECVAQANSSSFLSASVVICTRDRPDELKVCLSSLSKQSCAPSEIIVVDNASKNQRTREVAVAAGVTYVREERPGLDIARNTGALRATGEIVAYTDDDVLLHPRWLECLVSAFDAPEIGAVTGLVLPADLTTEAQRHFETYWGFNRGYSKKDIDSAVFGSFRRHPFPSWEIGAGASMAFRRNVFEKVGLFDERLGAGQAGCSEDSEYWYRLLANGYTCRYTPASVAFHFHRRTMEALGSQIYYYMRGHSAALLVQHERTGIRANRWRAYIWLPYWYSYRILRRILKPKKDDDRFLKEEIAGHLSGLLFYHLAKNGTDRRPS